MISRLLRLFVGTYGLGAICELILALDLEYFSQIGKLKVPVDLDLKKDCERKKDR